MILINDCDLDLHFLLILSENFLFIPLIIESVSLKINLIFFSFFSKFLITDVSLTIFTTGLKISAAFGRTAYTFIDKNNNKKLYSIQMRKIKPENEKFDVYLGNPDS